MINALLILSLLGLITSCIQNYKLLKKNRELHNWIVNNFHNEFKG